MILVGCVLEVIAQAYFFRPVTLSDGLPHGQISDLSQSSNGYMWIGTAASGLVSYDGTNFRTYGMQHGLRDDMVTQVFADSKSRLWVSTYSGGIATLQGDSLVYMFPGHVLDEAYITAILESPDGDLWFGTYEHGAFRYKAGEWSVIDTSNGLRDNTVWDIHWDTEGNVWFATHDGLAVQSNGEFTHLDVDDGLSGSRVYRFAKGPDGLLWMATSRGVTYTDGTKLTTITEIDGRPLGFVFDIISDRKGRIWIGTENDGVYVLDGDQTMHFTRADGLQSNYIYVLYEDRHGHVWIGTDDNGISIFTDDAFRRFNRQHGLQSEEIYSLIRGKDGSIWTGTELGLHQFADGRFNVPANLPEQLSNRPVWALASLSDGTIFALNDLNQIYHVTPNGVRRVLSDVLPEESWVIDVFTDSNGRLWIPTDYGLYLMENPLDGQVRHMQGLPGMVVYQVFESSTGTIWAATNLGVGYLNGDRFISYTVKDGLGHYNVNSITEDAYGEMWFGTSAGFTHFRANSDTTDVEFINFGRQHGMRLVETLFLIIDEDDQLWQGTNGGIHRFNLSGYREHGEMQAQHYRLSRYGIGVEVMQNAAFLSDDGMLWFGTMEGVLTADTRQIANREYPVPSAYIQRITVNGVLFSERRGDVTFHQSDGVKRLASGVNTLMFEFAGIEFANPQNLSFRYRLNGVESDWNTVLGSSSATYTLQRSGTYTFELQARMGDDMWSAEPVTFQFYISKPVWQQAWFWLVLLIISGTLTQWLFRLRIRKAETERLAQMVDEKTRDLQRAVNERSILIKEIHHRVKNNLAMISGLLEMQMEYLGDERVENAFSDAQMRIMSIALIHEKLYQNEDLSRIEVRTYVPQLLKSIIDTISGTYDSVKVHTDLDEIYLSVEKGIPCGLILNELVSNTFKHAFPGGREGNVMVSVKRKGASVVLTVEDDGVGLKQDFLPEQAHSLGLLLVRELSDLMKGKLTMERLEPGSRFSIEFDSESDDG